jgi:hypothetical protein
VGIPANHKTPINTLKHFFSPSCFPISETALLVLEGPLSSPDCPSVKSSFGDKHEYGTLVE